MTEQEAKQRTEPRKETKKSENVDEAIKFYAKRWNVTEEEAAAKMEKYLQNKKVASIEEMFPEPLGDLSAKVMEANQAILNTAMTRKKVAEIENPPKTSPITEDIDAAVHAAGANIIKEKLGAEDPIRKKVDEALGDFLGGVLKQRLEGKGGEDIKAAIDAEFDEFNEKMIKPIVDEIKTIKEATLKQAGTEAEMIPVSKVADKLIEMETNARTLLEARGFKVETVNIDKPTVEKMINDAVALEKKRQDDLRQKWELESGTQVTLESERIKATENILNGVTNRVFDIFLEPLRKSIQDAIEKGALGRAPPVRGP